MTEARLLRAPKKFLSPSLTSYDFIKTFALLTMVSDHLGAYFFPDELWWRAVGRLSAPVWIFLIGYARSRDLDSRLWVGCALLILATFITGGTIFPINILLPLLLTRMIIDRVSEFMLSDRARMIAGIVVLVALFFPAMILFEYGTLCVVVALCGVMARARLDGKPFKAEPGFMALGFVLFMIYSVITFDWKDMQVEFVFAGLTTVFALLYFFKPKVYPVLTSKMPSPVTGLLKLCGRWNFELYVIHLLLFKILAAYLGTGEYGFLHFKWL